MEKDQPHNTFLTPQQATGSRRFTLTPTTTDAQCTGCTGRTTLLITTPHGPVGTLRSTPPWWADIPDDPTQHPTAPHYEVQWSAYDLNGALLPLSAESAYFLAQQVVDAAYAGKIPVDRATTPRRR